METLGNQCVLGLRGGFKTLLEEFDQTVTVRFGENLRIFECEFFAQNNSVRRACFFIHCTPSFDEEMVHIEDFSGKDTFNLQLAVLFADPFDISVLKQVLNMSNIR